MTGASSTFGPVCHLSMRPIPWNAPSARGRCASSRLNRGSGSHPMHPRAPGPVGAACDATKSVTGSRGLAGARQPAAHLPPGSRHRLSAGRRAPRLTWRARGLHNLPQRSLRSAPAARIGRWSTREQPRSGAPSTDPASLQRCIITGRRRGAHWFSYLFIVKSG
jgi:hypothetical protein